MFGSTTDLMKQVFAPTCAAEEVLKAALSYERELVSETDIRTMLEERQEIARKLDDRI